MVSKKSTAVILCLLGVVGIYWVAQAGDLEPPGPPAPTMVTLQQIYDKVSASPVGIAKTGQTTSYALGDDGEYQAGVSVDPRFTENGDGTVSDNLTGLIWLKDANCFGLGAWADALSDANTLADGACGLTDGSVAGDWRLPNIKELFSLMDYSEWNPSLPSGHPFLAVQSDRYWSSTTSPKNTPPTGAFGAIYHTPAIFGDGYQELHRAWPVRARQ